MIDPDVMKAYEQHFRWSSVLITAVLAIGLPGIASAAEVCPAEATEERYGPFEAPRINEWYDTAIVRPLPCEILEVEFTVTSGSAVTFHVDLIGGTGVPFVNDGELKCEGICTFTVPRAHDFSGVVSAGWVSTAGEAGRISAVSVMVTEMAASAPAPQYRFSIRKQQRPGFNTGGVAFGSALAISSRPKALFMNLVAAESGQYFSVVLGAGETLRMSGVAFTIGKAGTRLRLDLHDEGFKRITPERHVMVSGETPFEFPSYTNTSNVPQLLYLRARIDVGLLESLTLYVQ
jgi:hypothetical protein